MGILADILNAKRKGSEPFNPSYDPRLWWMKGNCPVCAATPWNKLPNGKYCIGENPEYTLKLGYETLSLCEHHAKELASVLNNYFLKEGESKNGEKVLHI